MGNNIVKNKTFFMLRLLVILAIPLLLCGFMGYKGTLPQIGKDTKPPEQEEITDKPPAAKDKSRPEFPGKMTFPRIYSNYEMSRYSDYLKDIKQIEPILSGLKEVIKANRPDKIQQFCAKVTALDFYVEHFKIKYANKPERNYETFKQLVILDKNLVDAANYQRVADKYRNISRGSLSNKLEDEKFMRQKVDASLKSINSILEILKESN